MRRTLPVAALVLLPGIAAAQEASRPPQPLQELFFTEVVYPQSRHEVQLTFGSLIDRTREDKSALTPFSIEFGVTDRLQIEAEWDGYSQFRTIPVTHPRTSKLSVGMKYSLLNIGESPVHAAAGIDVEFPRAGVFAEGEGESSTEFEPFLALAVDLGRGVTVFGSGALSVEAGQIKQILGSHQPPDDRGTISGGALLLRGRVTFAAEYTSRSDHAPWRLDGSPLVTPSIALHPGGAWEFGVGLPIGTRVASRKPGLAIHLVKEF